jgi:hypothetical protein
MMPIRRHQIGAVGVVQTTGLAALIVFIYRHFGPEAQGPVTPSVIAVVVVGVFLLIGSSLFSAERQTELKNISSGLPIPTGLNLSAQGCEERATLDEKTEKSQP